MTCLRCLRPFRAGRQAAGAYVAEAKRNRVDSVGENGADDGGSDALMRGEGAETAAMGSPRRGAVAQAENRRTIRTGRRPSREGLRRLADNLSLVDPFVVLAECPCHERGHGLADHAASKNHSFVTQLFWNSLSLGATGVFGLRFRRGGKGTAGTRPPRSTRPWATCRSAAANTGSSPARPAGSEAGG